jgi:hypothetical protein
MSLYEAVLADPDSRDAYFNTTQAHLSGDPFDPSVVSLVNELEGVSVAFLFSPDEDLARPVLQIDHLQFVGEPQVRRAIASLAIRNAASSAA